MKQNDIDTLPVLSDYEMENIFNVYNEDGQYFYNLMDTVKFPDELDPTLYTLHTVGPTEHWNTISHKYYGTIKLWWIVCAVNKINNSVMMPPTGLELKILKPEVIPTILSQIK